MLWLSNAWPRIRVGHQHTLSWVIFPMKHESFHYSSIELSQLMFNPYAIIRAGSLLRDTVVTLAP